ncbi:hypothetical protein JW865_00630 [Candidatus Bathyarchaeota archaeon]|nr:hypothetical protein [Candidatus Bathyarchaeota archaeon]
MKYEALIAGILLLTIGGALASQTSNINSEPTPTMTGSLAKAYLSVSDLYSNSDLVARCKVLSMETHKIKLADQSGGTVPLTYVTVEVVNMINGSSKISTIIVNQYGGEVDGKLESVLGDPLMKTGDDFVLFLKESKSGNYWPVGGPQGRFPIVGGKVYSLADIDSTSTVPAELKTGGVDYAAFVRSLK